MLRGATAAIADGPPTAAALQIRAPIDESAVVTAGTTNTGKRKDRDPDTEPHPTVARNSSSHGDYNLFAVTCKEGRMLGKRMKHINLSGLSIGFELNPEHTVRFRSDGMVLLGDMLVATNRYAKFDNAQKAIKGFVDTDNEIVRGVDVIVDDTLTRQVCVVSTEQSSRVLACRLF